MNTYSDEDIFLLKNSFLSFKGFKRDVAPVYNGFKVIELIPGIRTSYEVYKINNVLSLTEEQYSYFFAHFGKTYDNPLFDSCNIKELFELRSLVFEVSFDDVPLYISQFPKVVKWRMELKK